MLKWLWRKFGNRREESKLRAEYLAYLASEMEMNTAAEMNKKTNYEVALLAEANARSQQLLSQQSLGSGIGAGVVYGAIGSILAHQALFSSLQNSKAFRPKEEEREIGPVEQREIAGPILALRGWSVTIDDNLTPHLQGVGVSHKWAAREADRATYIPIHRISRFRFSPEHGGLDGYWGLRFSEDIPEQADVAGIVALWGKVIPHDRGWRAEYAYPVVIWPNTKTPPPPMPGFPEKAEDSLLINLAERYGVKCLTCAPWEDGDGED